MKQKRTFLLAALVTLIAAMCLVFASCKAKYEVKWEVDSNATVTVEGYNSLPSKLEEGESIKFTVACAAHYEVDLVTAVNEAGKETTIKPSSDGSYSYTVTSAVTISVTAQKIVSGIEVATNPTKLTYVAGETLDTTGMVVNKIFEDGSKEAFTGYTVSSNSPLALGDTSFSVKYKTFSAEVDFTAAIEARITIDPMAGTIDEAWLTALKARADLHNVSVASDGTISFTYLALNSEISLPTVEQITPVSDGFYFDTWKATALGSSSSTNITSIAETNAISTDIEMSWVTTLVELHSLEFVDKDGGGNSGAYLKLNATFVAAEKAYIYLYEGNAKVELNGTEYEAAGTGKAQNLYFDLSLLSETGYLGKWMDVCFKATIGGKEFTQSFILDHNDPICDIGMSIQDEKWSYSLLTYRSGNYDYIKLAYQSYVTTYSFDFEGNNMTVSGTINVNSLNDANKALLSEAKAKMTIAGIEGEGTVDADGKWSITYDITKMEECGMTVLADGSLTIVNGETAIVSANLHFTESMTVYDYSGSRFSDPAWYSLEYITEDNIAVYVGFLGSDWNNAFYSVVDIGHQVSTDLNSAKLEVVNNTAYFVLEGTYGSSYATVAEAKAAIEEKIYFDWCDYSNGYATTVLTFGSPATDEKEEVPATMYVEVAEDGTFKLYASFANRAVDGANLYVHFGSGTTDVKPSTIDKEQTVTVDGLKYSFKAGSDVPNSLDWLASFLIVSIEDITAPSEDITAPSYANKNVSLEVSGEKAYLVINGTYQNYENPDDLKAVLEALYADVQNDPDDGISTDTDWTQKPLTVEAGTMIVVVNTDGTYKVMLDLSVMSVGSLVYAHFGSSSTNVTLPLAEEGQSVTVGGVTYTFYDSSSMSKEWEHDLVLVQITGNEASEA